MNDTTQPPALWSERDSFELALRQAKVYASSTIVPETYRDNLANCLIAMNMARRIGADIMQTMQSLHIIYGRPGWSAQFLIATFNQCGKYSALRYEWTGEKGTPEWGCRAWAIEKATKERIDGPWVTLKLVKDEGWLDRKDKNGAFVSKWRTMPELMFHYRAAAFLVRTHAPELAMGLQTAEEIGDSIIDITPSSQEQAEPATSNALEKLKERVAATVQPPHQAEPLPAEKAPELVAATGELLQSSPQLFDYPTLAERIHKAGSLEQLDAAGDLIRSVENEQQRAELDVEYRAARKRLQKG